MVQWQNATFPRLRCGSDSRYPLMEDKQAAQILLKLLEKYPLIEEEKEAISVAVGILGWTLFSQNRLKAKREKRDRNIEQSL